MIGVPVRHLHAEEVGQRLRVVERVFPNRLDDPFLIRLRRRRTAVRNRLRRRGRRRRRQLRGFIRQVRQRSDRSWARARRLQVLDGLIFQFLRQPAFGQFGCNILIRKLFGDGRFDEVDELRDRQRLLTERRKCEDTRHRHRSKERKPHESIVASRKEKVSLFIDPAVFSRPQPNGPRTGFRRRLRPKAGQPKRLAARPRRLRGSSLAHRSATRPVAG